MSRGGGGAVRPVRVREGTDPLVADHVFAPQRHREQVSLALVAGGVPPLPPLRAARSQRLLFPEDGTGIENRVALGLEAGDALVDWLDDQVVAGQGDLPPSQAADEGFRDRFGFGDLDVELNGFAGRRVGGTLDLLGVAHIRQDLNHERTYRCIQCPLVYFGLPASSRGGVAPVRTAHRPVRVRLEALASPAVQHMTAALPPADRERRAHVVRGTRPPRRRAAYAATIRPKSSSETTGVPGSRPTTDVRPGITAISPALRPCPTGRR